MTHTTTTKKAADATNVNGHTNTTRNDPLTGTAAEQAPSGKAIATEIALSALAGHAVHAGNCGDFTDCKYGVTKYCQDSTELKAFSRKVEVNHG
jgi:hypothetical protein